MTGGGKRTLPAIRIGAGLCLVSIVVFVLLKVVIASTASSAAEDIRRASVVTGPQQ
ncbi:MAG: hypothetical protein QM784_30120 [Polyangiaceae bacterium]